MIGIGISLVIFLLPIFSKRLLADDIKLPERFLFVLVFVILALGEVFICTILENILVPLATSFVTVSVLEIIVNVLIVGLIEEAIKYIVPVIFFSKNLLARPFLQNTKATNTSMSASPQKFFTGIALCISLFFACFETIAYSFEFNTFFSQLFLRRICTACLLHAGLSLFYYKIYSGKIKYFFICVALHCIYNFSTYYPILFFTLGLCIVLFCFVKLFIFFTSIQPTE
ncbi:MAG: hypothetical protein IJU92_03030 [Spirochaetaceae bacterium]|nr:hypothetical protein [Spirochaetaceae bacterium]